MKLPNVGELKPYLKTKESGVERVSDAPKRRRRSIRLQGYDYTRQGAYFITICTRNRACLLGDIVGGRMHLSEAGRLAQAAWEDLPHHYPHVQIDVWVIMPNHMHGIIILTGTTTTATTMAETATTMAETATTMAETATTMAETATTMAETAMAETATAMAETATVMAETATTMAETATTMAETATTMAETATTMAETATTMAETVGAGLKPAPTTPPTIPPTAPRHGLSEIVRAFKTFSARRINALHNTVGTPFWQRNYYEHIIRNESALEQIRRYIVDNPARWSEDRETDQPPFGAA